MRGQVNLCGMERGHRLRQAMVTLGLAIALVIVLAEIEASPLWWGTLLIPLFPTALLLVQAYTGVCVFHARDGTRSVGGMVEPILDPRKLTSIRAQGRQNYATTMVLALSTTLVVVGLASLR